MSLPREKTTDRNQSIAITGGGLIGLSIAWRLTQQGFHVVVFEKGAMGHEASWAGAGMLAPGGEIDGPSALATLAIKSRDLYPDFVRELERTTGMAVDYQQCGSLDLAYSPSEWDALQVRATLQSGLGIVSKIVSLPQLRAFWPRVNSQDLTGALFYPGDAIVNPRELVTALYGACKQSGVELREQCAVAFAEAAGDSVTVASDQGQERFDALVVAAGAWSSSIPVGGVPPLPLSTPVKGHLIGYHQPDQTCNTIIRHGHHYLLQRANGLLVAGASVEHVGWDRSVEPGIARTLAAQAGFILPHLAETSPSETWVGFRPASDELRIGRWHSRRVYLAYGHFRNGILLAPVTAEEVAREVTANL